MAEQAEGNFLGFSIEILDFSYGAEETVLDYQPVVQICACNAAADGTYYRSQSSQVLILQRRVDGFINYGQKRILVSLLVRTCQCGYDAKGDDCQKGQQKLFHISTVFSSKVMIIFEV